MPLSGFVPDLITHGDAATNDIYFHGQLHGISGTIYVFDKGFVNYKVFTGWGKQGFICDPA
jgi:hypothetical protein